MEAIIYFDIMTNDGYEIGVVVTAMLSGKYIPADFNHDIEDDRECLVSNIQFFNEEGEQFSGSEKLNEISNKIKEVVQDSPLGDAEKNIHALLQSVFTKMELVSREEFDVQAAVLRSTREKLDALEKQLAELTK
jgi:BMFP domain-containing protein YqiC